MKETFMFKGKIVIYSRTTAAGNEPNCEIQKRSLFKETVHVISSDRSCKRFIFPIHNGTH